jgi:hypothetical protein
MSTEYADSPLAFLQGVLGACSITKSVLQYNGYTDPDPDEKQNDYRADLTRMRELCSAKEIPQTRLADLEGLLDMMDQFVAQGRRATVAQERRAQSLNRDYVTWCASAFSLPLA